MEPVTIQLRWFHQFQFAGYYAAIEKGFYADEGLQVSLREFEPGRDRIAPVLEGKAQYGVGDPSLLKLRMQGKPVVVLAQIFQHSPSVLITMRESGIFSPDELAGKRVMLPVDDIGSAPIQALLLDIIGDMARITVVPHDFSHEKLIEGDVDAMTAYLSNQPFELKNSGFPVNVIDPRAYGIDFYGDNLFTTEKEITAHPMRVEKVLRATLKGWAYALEHKDEINRLIQKKYNPDLGLDQLRYEAKIVDQMIVPDLVPIGEISPKRYERMAATYHRLGMTPSSAVPDRFIYTAPAKPAVSLTAAEREWLRAHPTITLGYTDAFEPEVITNPDGSHQGILVDFLDELNRRLGTRIRLRIDPIPEVLGKAQKRETDGILNIIPEYADKLGLLKTDGHLTGYPAVFTHKDAVFDRPSDLAGKKVAIIDGVMFTELIVDRYGAGATILKVKDALEGLQRVDRGEVDLFLGASINAYFLSKYQLFGLALQYVYSSHPYTGGMAIRPDWPELVTILNKGIASFSKNEINAIVAKWISVPGQKQTLELTDEEQAWLKENPRIKIGLSPLPPYMFTENGRIQGYLIDIMEFLVSQVRLTADFSMQPIAETLSKIESGQLHAVLGMIHSQERAGFMYFSENVMGLQMSIFARTSRSDIGDAASLENKVIASIKGYGFEPVIKKFLPSAKIIRADDTEGMLRLVASGEADAAVQELHSGEFILRDSFINGVSRKGSFDPPGLPVITGSEFGVSKKFPLLNSILNKSYNALPESEKNRIWRKWFSDHTATPAETTIALTPEEQAWLAQDHTVQVRVVNIPPYIILKKGADPEGMSIDYLKLISERTGVKFKYVASGKAFPEALDGLKTHQGPDLITSLSRTPEREKSILFSKGYIRSPYVIFTHKNDRDFISDMTDLLGKKIALPRGTVIHEKVKGKYPELNLSLFDNDVQAIEAVATSKADAYIGNLTLASFLILEKGLVDLKIAGPSPFGDHLFSMGMRNDWPELGRIVDKALDTISVTEQSAIRSKYFKLQYEHGIKSSDVFKWIAIAVGTSSCILLLFIIWNRILKKQVQERTIALENSNKSLAAEVSQRTNAEILLRESRDYLKNLTDSLPDAVFSVKMPERAIEWANDTFKVLGYEPLECIGRTTEFLYSSKKVFLESGESLSRAIAEGKEVLSFEQSLRKKSGDEFPADVTISIHRDQGNVVSITGIVRDITERKQAEQKLQDYQQRLKALASQLTIAEEKERRTIAADLHDHVGHSLALARMQLNGILASDSNLERKILVKDISNIMLQALQETRSLIFELSSPSMNEIGLSAAISEWLEEQIEKRHGLKTEYSDTIEKAHRKILDENVRAIIFRNVRELLTNVVKHARAKKVSVYLKENANGVTVVIEDDGTGFDPEAVKTRNGKQGGFGLFSIQERMTDLGGTFDIQSAPGKGCQVVLTVPVEKENIALSRRKSDRIEAME